jgi:hypothetical protein
VNGLARVSRTTERLDRAARRCSLTPVANSSNSFENSAYGVAKIQTPVDLNHGAAHATLGASRSTRVQWFGAFQIAYLWF